MVEVDFYFDFSCPWSYLACVRLLETATRTGARIGWRPVALEWVLKQANPALVGSRVDPNPAKADYRRKDLRDWAVYCDVAVDDPPEGAVEVMPALRGAVVAADHGCASAYSRGVFAAHFGGGEDISDASTLRRIAESAGIPGDAFMAGLDDRATRERVENNSTELLRRGGFGTPTLFVGDAMFFGNDRMPLVEFAIGQASDRRFVVPGDHGA